MNLDVLQKNSNYQLIKLTDYWKDTVINSMFVSTSIFDLLIECFVDNTIRTYNPFIEHGAFLLGDYLKSSDGHYSISVDHFIQVEAEQQSITNIQFGSKAWLTLDKALEDNPNSKIVGWFHTHPGHGIFLSPDDLNVSYTYFNKPYQIALLLDNIISKRKKQLELGIFSYKENGEINNC